MLRPQMIENFRNLNLRVIPPRRKHRCGHDNVGRALLERSGSSKLWMEPGIRIERATLGLVIRVFGGFTSMRERMRVRDHLPDLLF